MKLLDLNQLLMLYCVYKVQTQENIMSKYTNKWLNYDTNEIIVSEIRPDGEYIYPLYAESRVNIRKNTYIPYDGNSEWVKAANKAMAKAAQG